MRGFLILALAVAALAGAGCNTLVGATKDAATVGVVAVGVATKVIP